MDAVAAEFNGEVDQERCSTYKAQLRAQGDVDAADEFDCAASLWFTTGKVKLWCVSVYYIIVTLTTCAPASLLRFWRFCCLAANIPCSS